MKALGVSCFKTLVLGEHLVIAAVRAEEDVAGQGLEGVKLLLEVGGHLGIFRVVDEVVAG